MKLHNTLTRTVETFKPQKDNQVSLYTCGPTVYDYAHIGNFRAFLFYDILRRALEANGFSVNHVMNITDVGHLVSDADEGEDKLEKGALREGKTVWDVAAAYTDAFKHDVQLLNILPPNGYHSAKYDDPYARATEFIGQQIEMVQLLLDKGFAYLTKQAIYFDITKLADYGVLTGQRLADKEVAARSEVVTDPDKKHPFDFAVWFFTIGNFKDHSMHWPSPWGPGFPGWHLECSAIIHATLGDPIDIHTGGIDHIGTHHPNEMAQTEAAFGHPLARFWVHNEFILVDGTKMSKSKGNFYVMKDILEKGFSPLAYRLLVLQAHYRSELNFTWESLGAAQNSLRTIQAWADLQFQGLNTDNDGLALSYKEAVAAIKEAVADDLNTPRAIAILNGMINLVDEIGADSDTIAAVLPDIDALLGLDLKERQDIPQEQKALIAKRQAARNKKDWAASDELRDTLAAQKIGVRDTGQGPVWYRI
jgi:cysteinyl-tRNA synthetase